MFMTKCSGQVEYSLTYHHRAINVIKVYSFNHPKEHLDLEVLKASRGGRMLSAPMFVIVRNPISRQDKIRKKKKRKGLIFS